MRHQKGSPIYKLRARKDAAVSRNIQQLQAEAYERQIQVLLAGEADRERFARRVARTELAYKGVTEAAKAVARIGLSALIVFAVVRLAVYMFGG